TFSSTRLAHPHTLHSFPTRRSSDLPDYVFLTPDKYAFDFITVVAPNGAKVKLDGQELSSQLCTLTPTDGSTPSKNGGKTPPFIKIGRAPSELQSLAYLVCRLLLEKK